MSTIKEKFEILKNYEQEHGKIPLFHQYMIFTQKGTLIKRPSESLRPLVQLVTNLGFSTRNAFHDFLREFSKYEEKQKKEAEKEQISNVLDNIPELIGDYTEEPETTNNWVDLSEFITEEEVIIPPQITQQCVHLPQRLDQPERCVFCNQGRSRIEQSRPYGFGLVYL